MQILHFQAWTSAVELAQWFKISLSLSSWRIYSVRQIVRVILREEGYWDNY